MSRQASQIDKNAWPYQCYNVRLSSLIEFDALCKRLANRLLVSRVIVTLIVCYMGILSDAKGPVIIYGWGGTEEKMGG